MANDIRVNNTKYTGMKTACRTSAIDVELFVVRSDGVCFFRPRPRPVAGRTVTFPNGGITVVASTV